MLIQFKVSNYRSIAKEQVLSLVPSTRNSEWKENILLNGKYTALNVVSIYGPNSSGKSNLLRAIHTLYQLMFLSSRTNSTSRLPYDPHLLIAGYTERPTEMEITFAIQGIRYRFGLVYDAEKVFAEYLFRKKTGREVELFYREEDTIDVSSALSGKSIQIDAAIESTRANALFISSCDQFNIAEAKIIYGWFSRLINIDGLNTAVQEVSTINLFEKTEQYRQLIVDYLRRLDLGFHGIKVHRKVFDTNDVSHVVDDAYRNALIDKLSGKVGHRVETIHNRYDEDGKIIDRAFAWNIQERESAGTHKAFQLSGPIVFALQHGTTLVVDEIEAKLHTKLTQSIIQLFLDKRTNPRQAQLIFATHDTNLLDTLKLRRDQINFVEKNRSESTEIYSLSDIVYKDGKKERMETDKEKRYLEDRYGATPNIELLTPLINTRS